MPMTETAAFVMLFVLLHGLIGKLAALRTLGLAKIPAVALRELTGLVHRSQLVARFGPHDEDFCFAATPAAVFAARPWWRWILGNMLLELALVLALIATALGSLPASPWLPAGAALYFALSQLIAIRAFRQSRAEVEEELAAKESHKRARRQNQAQGERS